MKNDVENKLKFINLLDIYIKLLSDTQQKILSDYYYFDLSLSEIASNNNITRSAVMDAIHKGQNKLMSLEETLNLLKKREQILNIVAKLRKNVTNDEKNSLLDQLERKL